MAEIKSEKPSPASPPIPFNRLTQICNDACTLALDNVTTYEHTQTQHWNTNIISKVLRSLISESTPQGQQQPPYKFIVNSTIVQHLGTGSGTGVAKNDASVGGVGGESVSGVGRRGLQTACSAYWNAEKDGMWSYKHGTKFMDVVIVITWIGI